MTPSTRASLRDLADSGRGFAYWLVWKPIWAALCIGIAIFEALARKGRRVRTGP